MTNQDELRRRIERCRQKLVPRTRRNKALYYKENASTTINLRKLVHGDKDDARGILDRCIQDETLDLGPLILRQASTEQATLTKRLTKLRLQNKAHQQEYGIAGAWLLGPFLCWRAADPYEPGDMMISPVLKVPVDVAHKRGRQPQITLDDPELQVNPDLVVALKTSLGVNVPKALVPSDIEEIGKQAWNLLSEALQQSRKSLSYVTPIHLGVPRLPRRFDVVRGDDGEEISRKPVVLEDVLGPVDLALFNHVTADRFVLLDVAYVDFFNASTAVLFSDYESVAEAPNALIRELLMGTAGRQERADAATIHAIDQYKESFRTLVAEHDASQRFAIEMAGKKRILVIQGPPGTGKSQTITNLISERLAKGQTVLFVAEKKAALDVVATRLAEHGLGEHVALLGSSKLDKASFYKTFLDPKVRKTTENWNTLSEDIDEHKNWLRQHYESLGEVHPALGLNTSEILALASATPLAQPARALPHALNDLRLPHDELTSFATRLAALESNVRSIPSFPTNPWRRRKKNLDGLGPQASTLQQFCQLVGVIRQGCAQLRQAGIQAAPTAATLELLGAALGSLSDVSALLAPCVCVMNNGIASFESQQRRWTTTLKKHKSAFDALQPAATTDQLEQMREIEASTIGALRWLRADYWRYRRLVRQCFAPHVQPESLPHRSYYSVIESHVHLATNAQEWGLAISREFQSIEATSASIERLASGIRSLAKYLSTCQALTGRPIAVTVDGVIAWSDNLRAAHTTLRNILQSIEQATHLRQVVNGWFEKPVLDSANLADDEAFATQLAEHIPVLSVIEKVENEASNIEKRFKVAGVIQIIDWLCQTHTQDWAHVVPQLMLSEARRQLLIDSQKRRHLSSTDFRDYLRRLDADSRSHCALVHRVVSNMMADRLAACDKQLGLGILTKEANKQRRVKAPRAVMELGAAEFMLAHKPCWLMSPLSISQILPTTADMFDAIIFDEASQVRVETALPAISRAKEMIVVGDPMQMPPTTFFTGAGDADDDDDEADDDAESVLEIAIRSCPTVLLEWHYRSHDESLIAFSNRAFYGGRLIAPPNPQALAKSKAIEFHRINDATFSHKSGNSAEAHAVVDRLKVLLEENECRSFGIVAMGHSQKAMIEQVIDERSQRDSKLERLLSAAEAYTEGDREAGLFIKNIENVQGDERDIILMSVGYAPTSPGKKVRLGFGPLSTKGGRRRLNVAITRARRRMVVFCSFSPEIIPSGPEADNQDLAIFGKFLQYCHHIAEGHEQDVQGILNSFGVGGAITDRRPTRFALDVKRRLENRGWTVVAEVGSCGYFVDLAIVHPLYPDSFVLGVECDGMLFHSLPYTRTRDGLRQGLLESRGWKIERIGSLEWSTNWTAEISRVEQRLSALGAVPGSAKGA